MTILLYQITTLINVCLYFNNKFRCCCWSQGQWLPASWLNCMKTFSNWGNLLIKLLKWHYCSAILAVNREGLCEEKYRLTSSTGGMHNACLCVILQLEGLYVLPQEIFWKTAIKRLNMKLFLTKCAWVQDGWVQLETINWTT